jgi:hypothetical protein
MSFDIHVSDTRVEVSGLPLAAERGLRAVWGLSRPVLRPRYVVHFHVTPDAEGFTLRTDGEVRATAVHADDVLALVEAVLYRDIEAWTPPRRAILHAAAAHLDGRTYVLSGASGAGKSSLVYALLRQGASYLSDELTLFDGKRVWGVARAPQLDPIPVGAQLPQGFPPADLESYVFRSVDGPRALPLLPVDAEQMASTPYPVETVQVVFPHRDARTSLSPLARPDALVRLCAEVRGTLARDLGPLLARPPLALAWRTPVEAVDALLQAREDA